MLVRGLSRSARIGASRLHRKVTVPPLDLGDDAWPAPAPDWSALEPPRPSALGRLIGGEGRYQQRLGRAQAAFEQACTAHGQAEAERQRRVSDKKSEHAALVAEAQRQIDEYNQEIDPQVFQLDLPKDVVTIDQTNQTIGLEKGDLTNDEIAAKVAKEFFEALIAKDYAKAGILLEGIPAEKMKEMFGRYQFQRIVAVGKPAPGPIPAMKALRVPVTVEVDGKKQTFAPLIRPVYSHPDRWGICGGI